MFKEYVSPVIVPDGITHACETGAIQVQFPYVAYDTDSVNLWHDWVASGSLGDKTVHVIHTVSDSEKPIRWLTNLIDIAELVEGLQNHGFTPPEKVKLMGLIHTNAAANNGNGLHVEQALKQADFLKRLAESYLDAFHPTVWIDFEYEFDSEEIIPELLDYGRELFPNLKQHVRSTLSRMAEKYNRNPRIPNHEFGAAYFLAHNGAYRRFVNPFGPFKPDINCIFAIPQSERLFVDMLQESDAPVNALGLETRSSYDAQNIFLLSRRNRISHYYAVAPIDPTLEGLLLGNPWPSAEEILRGKSFSRARTEAFCGIRAIETDVGGNDNVQKLIGILRDAHDQTYGTI